MQGANPCPCSNERNSLDTGVFFLLRYGIINKENINKVGI